MVWMMNENIVHSKILLEFCFFFSFLIQSAHLYIQDSCFDILVPKPDEDIALDFDSLLRGVSGINSTAANVNTGSLKDTIITHGLGSSRYRLTIDLSTEQPVDVQESVDNEVVYENLREYYGVLSKNHIKLVKEWLDGLVKSDSEVSSFGR